MNVREWRGEVPEAGALQANWPLDPDVVFLNHGSFGSCPFAVSDFQEQLRRRLERQPVAFLVRELEVLLMEAQAALGAFLGARPEDLVFVNNATTGLNTVLRSLRFEPGDELLVTNHEYNASRNALEFAASRAGARVVVADVPFPISDDRELTEAIFKHVGDKTRLALLDHVTSQTGIVMPLERLVPALQARGVDVLVDGAHAPGMIPLNLEALDPAYYTGNCHKWICAPKGAAFLYVRPDRQGGIRPLTISHGANSPRTDRSRFQIEFGWMGTTDPTAWLSIPEALRVMNGMVPGGWPEVMRRNHELVCEGRRILCETLSVREPCPEQILGSLASIPIPDGGADGGKRSPLYSDPVQDRLWERYRIEVPVIPWPSAPKRLLRISAQLYNSAAQYRYLAGALQESGF